MLLKHLILCSFLITWTLAYNPNHYKQTTLLPFKNEPSSYLIKLDSHKVPFGEHQKLIALLQQAHDGLKSQSFLQREIQPINIDNLNGTSLVPIQNHKNTQVKKISS